ncbi:MAG: hypothetical protein KJP23_12520, partial [Deltaproteobacteria bacterium]|nr:hypothetical protein [Deltaproteobacteria bacterium]
MKILRCLFSLILLLLLAACTGPTVRDDYPEPEAGSAFEPGQDGPFANLEADFAKTHGSQESGFLLLENNTEDLKWRVA